MCPATSDKMFNKYFCCTKLLIKNNQKKTQVIAPFLHCLLFTAKALCVRACVCSRPPCPAVRQTCSPMTYLSAALWEQRLFFESEQQIKILICSAGLQRDNVLFGRLLLCKKAQTQLSTRPSSVINFYHCTGIYTSAHKALIAQPGCALQSDNEVQS